MKVVAVGDAIISRRLSFLDDAPFARVVDEVRGADGAYVNFEMVIPRLPAIPEATPKAIRIAAPPWTLDELRWMGFNLYGLANNHAYDFTHTGLHDTVELFEHRGLAFSGAGRSLQAARRPAYLDTSAGRIAMLNVASTAAPTSLATDPGVLTAPRTGINPLRFDTEYRLEPTHFQALRRLDEALGTAATTRALLGTEVFPGPRLIDASSQQVFMGRRFSLADTTAVVTRPSERDLAEIGVWIDEARRSADLVVVGMHCHESADDGLNLDPPADFIPLAARSFVDAGADLVVGHGPHRIRGIEIYQGCPILYSLGNFMFMDDSLEVFDPAQYEAFGLGRDATPADLHDYRERRPDGSPRGFHAEQAFWEGLLATCEFVNGRCTAVRLLPVHLDAEAARSQRGIPRAAGQTRGADVLRRLMDLSAPYGTTIDVDASGSTPVGCITAG